MLKMLAVTIQNLPIWVLRNLEFVHHLLSCSVFSSYLYSYRQAWGSLKTLFGLLIYYIIH